MGKHFMQVVSFPFPFSDICGMPLMHQALWQALLPILFHLVLKGKKQTNCKVEIINSIV